MREAVKKKGGGGNQGENSNFTHSGSTAGKRSFHKELSDSIYHK